MSEEFVRVRRTGHLGHLTLDRPRQLNALTLGMITAMRKALLRWENDPEIRQILIDGAGDRGFCAGGDIRVVHDSARDGTDAAEVLWREEYLLDALIGDYGKPVVVLMDGITMGGGIGLGGHASHRVVTERSVLAMPEVNLGIAPDVGGSLLFARAPGVLGRHLAMTGARFGAGDAIHCGFADVRVDSADLPALSADLAVAPAEDVVKGSVPPSPLSAASWISECYATDDAATILQRLREVPEAATAVRQIEAASPLAVRVALAAVGRAASLELPEVLDQDLRAGLRLIEGPDPVEGIRAVVVDKAHRPRWSALSVADVRADEVERCFEGLGDRELRARQRMRA